MSRGDAENAETQNEDTCVALRLRVSAFCAFCARYLFPPFASLACFARYFFSPVLAPHPHKSSHEGFPSVP